MKKCLDPQYLANRQERTFWSKIIRNSVDECWLWMASRNARGYGMVHMKGRSKFAHRIAFSLHYGEIPEGAWVLHRCDNPPCCNPSHLFLGDHAANIADMVAKKRARSGVFTHPEKLKRGEGVWRSKLSESDVREIRKRRELRESAYAIAPMFNVKASAIYKIEHGKTWRHIQ